MGYHCEGGDTHEAVGRVPLSMSTLNDGRPLFLCPDYDSWFPHHLSDKSEYKVYRVVFKAVDFIRLSEFWVYHDLFSYNTKNKNYDFTKEMKYFIRCGFNLFVLEKNKQNELPEALLLNPTKHVVNISKFSVHNF